MKDLRERRKIFVESHIEHTPFSFMESRLSIILKNHYPKRDYDTCLFIIAYKIDENLKELDNIIVRGGDYKNDHRWHFIKQYEAKQKELRGTK